MEPLKNRTITDLCFFDEPESRNNLRLLFKFHEGGYLFFDSSRFFLGNSGNIDRLFKWRKIAYSKLNDRLSITKLREDECTTYFIEFSNGDIFHVYQLIDGTGFWAQDFEIVSKNDMANYAQVTEYMNEDFVTNVELTEV
jgi:hypothetical protein